MNKRVAAYTLAGPLSALYMVSKPGEKSKDPFNFRDEFQFDAAYKKYQREEKKRRKNNG